MRRTRWRPQCRQLKSFLTLITAVGGSIVFFQQLVLVSRVELYHHANSPVSHCQPSQPGYGHRYNTSSSIVERFLISFDLLANVNGFDDDDDSNPLSVVPAVDGYHQRNLNLWAKLTDQYPPLNVSSFSHPKDRRGYVSPKAIGCYLSHWNLLHTLSQRPASLRPEAFMVLEDDASCAHGLMQHVRKTLSVLPADWDLLFVGGKPFTYFGDKATMKKLYLSPRPDASRNTLRRDICLGDLGRGRGPLAPDGSRALNPDTQAYWKVDYMTNTEAYVVNPARLTDKIIPLLKPKTKFLPIDMTFGELMSHGELNGYMTTRRWCKQLVRPKEQPLSSPTHWPGFFGFLVDRTIPNLTALHPAFLGRKAGYIWQEQIHLENCTF